MGKKSFQADQLIPTSSTPPPEAGFYRIDRQTIGVVGNMSFRDPNTQAMMPVGKGAIPFTNFAPRLVASLVASSTAACTSGVVTVTATAHAIPASTFDGYPIYYPGSPSLAAGFYENLLVIDANSFTFNAPLAANFLSESVNGGAILTAEVTVASMIIPANTFTVGDFVETLLLRRHSSTAGTKLTNLYYGTSNVGDSSSTSTTNVFGIPNIIFLCEKQAIQRGVRGLPGSYTASSRTGTMDIGTDKTLSVANSLTAASDWIMTYGCKMRIF